MPFSTPNHLPLAFLALGGFLALLACGSPPSPRPPSPPGSLEAGTVATASPPTGTAAPKSPSMTLLKKVTITTDAEGRSARPEIVATADRVFVVYLGNTGTGGNRNFSVRIYDRSMDNVIASRVLATTTPEYGGPTDVRVASDGGFLDAFYETHKPTSPTTGVTYLWGARYTLDDRFERVAYTATPIATSKPMAELQEGGELLDDPAPLVGPESVFVVTRLKHSLSLSGKTVYRVREFDRDSLTMRSRFDLDLSDAADGRGRVASLLYSNGTIFMVLATTVADQGLNEAVDDGALSDIILVRMRRDWKFDPGKDVRVLSASREDRENYVSGFREAGGLYFVTHKQSKGLPPSGEHVGWIKVFDGDFSLVHEEKVRSTKWGAGGGEMRPSLEVMGSRVFSGQSAGDSLGTGNAEVWVYEFQSN